MIPHRATSPPPPTQPLRPKGTPMLHFREKGVFSQWVVQIREIKKKGHFPAISPRKFEKE